MRKIHPKGDRKGLHSESHFLFTLFPCIFHSSGPDDAHFEGKRKAMVRRLIVRAAKFYEKPSASRREQDNIGKLSTWNRAPPISLW